jgi:predicted negative regulator of RcsB-dependent stress response
MPDAKPNPAAPETPAGPVPASPVEQFLEANFKKIIIALAAVVLLLLIIGASRHFSRQTELEAAQKFTSAKTVEDCDVVAQQYAGTQAAGNAILLKAALLWDAGKKESSVAALQDFIKNQPDHLLLPNAKVSLGSKQASLGDNDVARKTLEAVVHDYPKTESAAAAQAELGDLLWAEGKVDEAKKVYTELPRNYPGSPFVAAVDQRIKMIDAGLPSKEVDAPPPPPKPAEGPNAALPPIPGLPTPLSKTPTINVPPSLTAPLGALPPTPPAPGAPAAPKPEEKTPATPPTPVPPPAPTPEPKAAAPAAPAPESKTAPKAEEKPAAPPSDKPAAPKS